MIERKRGRIVNVASDAGRVGSLGETVYAGTKGGLVAFTKSLAREMARYGINVNCVCPGPTDTPLMAAVPDKVKDALIKAIPLRGLGRPEETADAIVFFCGPGCSYITGQVLSVSGGLTMASSAVSTWAETTTGSTPSHGKPPWVCLPLILMRTVSPLANCGPLR